MGGWVGKVCELGGGGMECGEGVRGAKEAGVARLWRGWWWGGWVEGGEWRMVGGGLWVV